MSQFYNDSIFWIDVEKISPNPFQPRREFDEMQLQSLADSIRQYGVLQALVVTRKEVEKDDGGLAVQYELIAGERRLRASKLAGLTQVPVLIKVGDEANDLMKLELAIIENIQREDLNPVDRARAFERLSTEFGFKHIAIAEKVGKSREYVSNTLRLLMLPPEILDALSQGKISEGHSRPLMMLSDRPDEQNTVFKEIMFKKLSVRETEAIARRIAYDKIRKKGAILDPETQELEEKLTETLGTRVSIEKRENGGKILIDFFSADDLRGILDLIKTNKKASSPTEMMDRHIEANPIPPVNGWIPNYAESKPEIVEMSLEDIKNANKNVDDRLPEEIKKEENTDTDEMYSIKNFSI
ncbi:MAG: ParB/RepB/Spo0J family partition protein [Patescibacteria group bacterium]